MNEAQKICAAKKDFADALYDSNIFPMWKRNNYGTATRVRVSLNKNSKQICVRASDAFLFSVSRTLSRQMHTGSTV